MLTRRLYYGLKPYVPKTLRLALRRALARRVRQANLHHWPIDPTAGTPPPRWSGWPGGKRFAFALTHDVESPTGLARCRELMKLESALGVRSSFNFIPAGPYHAPAGLREDLRCDGFEIGVHDLAHDGKLFDSRAGFAAKAREINRWLEDWGAEGFRSGFMLRNLDWLHHLEISYDSSTFDTDPFEPQPDGVGTIFPFWIAGPDRSERTGYVELPYTVPQDFTVFVLLGERGPDLWKAKVDWIAEHGGMVLLDTHPDYMAFDGAPGWSEYPADWYREFVAYVCERYAGAYWQALPAEIASFTRAAATGVRPALTQCVA